MNLNQELWRFYLLVVLCLSPVVALCWWLCGRIETRFLRCSLRVGMVLALIIPVKIGTEGVAIFPVLLVPVFILFVLTRGVVSSLSETSIIYVLCAAFAIGVVIWLRRIVDHQRAERLFRLMWKSSLIHFLFTTFLLFGFIVLNLYVEDSTLLVRGAEVLVKIFLFPLAMGILSESQMDVVILLLFNSALWGVLTAFSIDKFILID